MCQDLTNDCCAVAKGPSIKYITLFLANFYSPPPCHTSSHIPRPPRKYVTHLGPRIFRRPSTKNPDKSPLVQILSQLLTGFLSGGFCQEVFCLEGFIRGWLLSISVMSEYICYIRKLNITLNFMFHKCGKKSINVMSHALYPLPLSQTVTPSRTPSPSSMTYFMDGPQRP